MLIFLIASGPNPLFGAEGLFLDDKQPEVPQNYLQKAETLLVWNRKYENESFFYHQYHDEIKIVLDDPLQTPEHRYLAASYYANYLTFQTLLPPARQLCERFPPRTNDYVYQTACLQASELPITSKAAGLRELAEQAYRAAPQYDYATRIYVVLANLLMEHSRVIAAIRDLKRALEIVPQNFPSLVIDLKTTLAFAYINPMQSETLKKQAIIHLKEGIAFYESDENKSLDDASILIYNLGIVHLFLFADYDAAIIAFQKSRDFSRLTVDSDVFTAHAMALKGETAKATKMLQTIKSKDFGDDTRSQFLRCYYQLTRHLLDSSNSIEACISMEIPQADVLMNLTETLSKLKLPPEIENQWWRKFYRRFQDSLLPDIQANIMAASAETELVEERAESRLKDLKLKNLKLYEYLLLAVTALCLLLATAGTMSYKARQTSLRFARQVNQQRKRLQHILDSVVECIYVISSELRMDAEPTPHFAKVLGDEFTYQMDLRHFLSLTQVAKDHQATILGVIEASFGEESLVWELNVGHLPFELCTSHKTLSLSWEPVFNDGRLQSIFLAIRDVTEQKALKEASEQARRNADQLIIAARQIMQAPRRPMLRFLADLSRNLETLQQLVQSENHKAAVRFVHGMKGDARNLGLAELRDSVHELESQLLSGDTELIRQALESVTAAINRYLAGQDFMRLESEEIEYSNVFSIVAELKPALINQLSPHAIPLKNVSIEESGQLEPIEYRAVKGMLLHALTNALDHGYILPRQKGHAVPPVMLKVELHSRQELRQLIVRDQGMGIDYKALQELAARHEWQPEQGGLWTDILFLDGISTTKEVTLSSGRGVGLSAIAATAAELKASLKLQDNDQGQGAMLLITWPQPAAALDPLADVLLTSA